MKLDAVAAKAAIDSDIAKPLSIGFSEAMTGVSQMVDENMANAARVHAVESGKDYRRRTMVAFGGNGPLHASRVAERIGVSRVIVPPNPSVGSAIGFLGAPISYEIVRSLYTRLDSFDLDGVNNLLDRMRMEATKVVTAGAGSVPLQELRTAFMRYKGQGHEIEVPLLNRPLIEADIPDLRTAYETRYRSLFQRSVPGMTIEIMNWGLTISTVPQEISRLPDPVRRRKAEPDNWRQVCLDPTRAAAKVPVYSRSRLASGDWLGGPALIVEGQTTSFVGSTFDALIDDGGNIVMSRRNSGN
jgi:N-methylhydantoinase A